MTDATDSDKANSGSGERLTSGELAPAHPKTKSNDGLEEILGYLYGENQLDGVWYGKAPEGQSKFWWRPKLRKALHAYIAYIDSKCLEAREVFVPVRGAEGYYEVSNTGKVRSVPGGRRKGGELKQCLRNNIPNRAYMVVTLVKGGRTQTAAVHRLVAHAFLSNPENKRCVNHKNGVKHDNDVDNLEWATYSENELHAYSALGKVNANDPKRIAHLKQQENKNA